jgi:tRNA uracil 4-sulfurtransferase
VAAWRLIKRGIAVDYLLCNLGGAANERSVLQVTKVLVEMWEFGYRPSLYVVDFAPLLSELSTQVPGSYRQVVLKRLMYRAGAALAEEIGAEALVTGEALGQVSSQTAANLRAIETAAGELPVYRPLIGADKQEIIADARHIGTAPLSERVRELCALNAGPPVVRATAARAAQNEARIDPGLLDRAVSERKAIDLLDVSAKDLRAPYLFTDTFPRDAVVIDCRSPHQFREWHVPGAVHRDPFELMDSFRKLDKRSIYVLYCSYGTQTPLIAEIMQQFGYEAYAFRGGIQAVRDHVEKVRELDRA